MLVLKLVFFVAASFVGFVLGSRSSRIVKVSRALLQQGFFVLFGGLGFESEHGFFVRLEGILELRFVLFRMRIRGVIIKL